ncbi:MAG: hypothetical protein PHW46_02880 [Candidatus Omnitrophica bacterium]|nr:hypothetical protein [Candidatus Omnitrophota bacterium]
MKKVIFSLFLLFTCASAYGENWYAVSKYDVFDEKGDKTSLRTVTKVRDQDTCYKTMVDLADINLNNIKWVNAECISGYEYDVALESVFNKKDAPGVYIYYVDKAGHKTIADFPDTPNEACVKIAKNLALQMEAKGSSEVQIIFPVNFQLPEQKESPQKAKTEDLFTIGATKDDVRRIQGEPTSVVGEIWFYGYDYAGFDEAGNVNDLSNILGNLKIK